VIGICFKILKKRSNHDLYFLSKFHFLPHCFAFLTLITSFYINSSCLPHLVKLALIFSPFIVYTIMLPSTPSRWRSPWDHHLSISTPTHHDSSMVLDLILRRNTQTCRTVLVRPNRGCRSCVLKFTAAAMQQCSVVDK
jgi:hypothetical protein